MSTTTNVVSKLKQLFYNAGENSTDVSDAVEALNDIIINVKLPNGNDGNAAAAAANSSVTFTLPVNATLHKAYMTSTNAIDNAAADTIFVNVSVNAVSSIAFDSDATDGIAANGVYAMTVTNADLDAGEKCIVSYAQQTAANNYVDGILTLVFRPA